MNKFNLIFFSLISVFVLQSSLAWGKQNDVAVFNQQIKSEVLVVNKLTEALEKNLDSKLFEVKVQTEISKVSLEVQKVYITLQLSQKLTQNYRVQLTKWIQAWVETTYGVRGDARVEWMPIEATQAVSAVWFDLILLGSLLATAMGLLIRAVIKARPPVQLSFSFIEGKLNNELEAATAPAEEVFTIPVEQLALIAQPEILVIEPIVSVEPFIEIEEEMAIEIVSPFAFIDQIDNEKLKALFSFFDLSEQVAFFMKAPRSSVQRLTSSLDKKLVMQILTESAFVKDASDEDLIAAMQLWQESQQTKAEVIQVVEANEKFLRFEEIWLELSVKDKVLLLEKLSSENPELAAFFLQGQEQVNSLKKWSSEKLRKFCLQMRTRDLAAAITELPFLAETILSVCPESMKKAILCEAQSMDAVKTESHFASFVFSFERYLSKATAPKPEANLLQIRTQLLQ